MTCNSQPSTTALIKRLNRTSRASPQNSKAHPPARNSSCLTAMSLPELTSAEAPTSLSRLQGSNSSLMTAKLMVFFLPTLIVTNLTNSRHKTSASPLLLTHQSSSFPAASSVSAWISASTHVAISCKSSRSELCITRVIALPQNFSKRTRPRL